VTGDAPLKYWGDFNDFFPIFQGLGKSPVEKISPSDITVLGDSPPLFLLKKKGGNRRLDGLFGGVGKKRKKVWPPALVTEEAAVEKKVKNVGLYGPKKT
jgi:hypothetical protein